MTIKYNNKSETIKGFTSKALLERLEEIVKEEQKETDFEFIVIGDEGFKCLELMFPDQVSRCTGEVRKIEEFNWKVLKMDTFYIKGVGNAKMTSSSSVERAKYLQIYILSQQICSSFEAMKYSDIDKRGELIYRIIESKNGI